MTPSSITKPKPGQQEPLPLERYAVQMRVAEWGEAKQRQLQDKRVLIVGCGALGSTLAQLMVRVGIGELRLVDRDRVELTNLHRQLLYDEEDVRSALPKAEIAARKLRPVNSTLRIEAVVGEATAANLPELAGDRDVILDGTDNLETRYAINAFSIRSGVPWVYGGILGTSGITLTILPRKGPCFRCLFPHSPDPNEFPSTRTHGVWPMVPAMIAAMQASEACKLLAGEASEPAALLSLDLWQRTFSVIPVQREEGCQDCGDGV